MYDRKAQNLTVQTFIIVALGVLVLVLSIVGYNKYYKNSESTISSCKNHGGECMKSCPDGVLEDFTAKCPDENQVCCLT